MAAPLKPYRIWVLECPFRKTGSPILGTIGSTIEPVVVMKLETWQRIVEEAPVLAETQFEVGTYD